MEGSLSMDNVVVRYNKSEVSGSGIENNGSLELSNVTIEQNVTMVNTNRDVHNTASSNLTIIGNVIIKE